MKTNPFATKSRQPIAQATFCPQSPSESESEDPVAEGNEHSPREDEAERTSGRVVKHACVASIVFLVLVLFVFREIQHTRELYQMSRMISVAEAERRHWQEKLRLEEGRAAGLAAMMHSQQSLPQYPKVIRATHVVPARRR